MSIIMHQYFNSSSPGSSGIISLYNLTPRISSPLILKVVARDQATREKAVIGRRIYVHPDETFCSVILINRGVTISGDNATVEFRGVGKAAEYLCVLDHMQFFRPCKCDSTVLVHMSTVTSSCYV